MPEVRTVLASLLVVAAAVAVGCGDDSASGGDVTVVATTTEVADLVRQVGGARVDVEGMLRPGGDPHDYEPRPSDVAAVASAQVVFRSGGEMDDWLSDVIDNAGGDAEVVSLIDSVRRLADDPHWWQDATNGARAVEAIRAALTKADPGGRTAFARNAERMNRTLERLDRQIAACVERVPAAKRKIVTTHDALGYFARRYRVEVVGAVIPSLSTQAQASAGDVERLVEQIRREGVEAIFPESSVNPDIERAIAREAGASIGDPLYADSLGAKGSPGETYPGALAADAAALVRGMSGGRVNCDAALRSAGRA
jgi:ABC-type Zn uptake system ZnuABC Zn-binding protein ZnuA